jgi:hypothetical protein
MDAPGLSLTIFLAADDLDHFRSQGENFAAVNLRRPIPVTGDRCDL